MQQYGYTPIFTSEVQKWQKCTFFSQIHKESSQGNYPGLSMASLHLWVCTLHTSSGRDHFIATYQESFLLVRHLLQLMFLFVFQRRKMDGLQLQNGTTGLQNKSHINIDDQYEHRYPHCCVRAFSHHTCDIRAGFAKLDDVGSPEYLWLV